MEYVLVHEPTPTSHWNFLVALGMAPQDTGAHANTPVEINFFIVMKKNQAPRNVGERNVGKW
jgi:hypothetical protein